MQANQIIFETQSKEREAQDLLSNDTKMKTPRAADAYKCLLGIDYMIIDQEQHFADMFLGCVKNANYSLYQTTSKLQFERYPMAPPLLGTFQESSNYCCRQVLQSCREFQGTLSFGKQLKINVTTPIRCHCPVPCCSFVTARPTTIVTDENDGLIGSIRMPFYGPLPLSIGSNNRCPLVELEVLDDLGEIIYRIKSSYCQKSVICSPFQVCGCENTEFGIYDKKNNSTDGFIRKTFEDCVIEFCTPADLYVVKFPPECSPRDKILLIQAGIWIDYLRFSA